MRLPFAEDLREFEFAALDATAPKPSTAQLDAAENLIRRMEVGDDWAPENVKNPALQRLHNCLQARVRDPDAPLDLQSPENTALSAKIAALKQQSKVADAIGKLGKGTKIAAAGTRHHPLIPRILSFSLFSLHV